MECATADVVGNKEDNMKGKQPERESLVPKFWCMGVVCPKCRHGALTNMMYWGQKNFACPILQSPYYLYRQIQHFLRRHWKCKAGNPVMTDSSVRL